jgi:hypothetical protein
MKQMTPEERTAFAKKGYQEKVNPSIPRATHIGVLKIGDQEIDCAVLSDGRRVLSARTIYKVMRGRDPRSRDRKKSEGGLIPVFLTANNLKQFIINDLSKGPSQGELIVYKNKSNLKTKGYECSMLTIACDAYLLARDAGKLTSDQLDLAKQCEIIMRGLAKTGLVALIDECTGYQEVRDRHALQAILDKYLRTEFAEWSKRFPPSFYAQIFRLNNWKFADISTKKPMIIGKYTNDVVYSRLLPELVDELQNRNPKNEIGYRESKHHQWLSDIGNVDLDKHIHAVTALMRCCQNWKEFKELLDKELLDKVYPIKSTKDIFIKK